MDLFNNDDAIENASSPPRNIDHEKDAETVDKTFEDVDDFEDVNDWGDVGPRIETVKERFERERKRAEKAHEKDVYVSATPHEVLPSSSPARPDFTSKKAKETEGGKTKERRKPVILNEMTLIGPTGFPALIQDMKGFKPKGKGHEEQDLDRLLSRYQFWTQRMFPKSQFRDTVDRIEKLSRSRMMHSHLSNWRDEALGINKGTQEEAEDQPPPSEAADPVPSEDAAATQHDSDVANYASSSPAPPTRPPSSSGVSDMDDDAEMQEPSGQGADQSDEIPFEEEWNQGDDEDWSNLPDDPISAPPDPKGKAAPPPDDEDAMWKDFDDFDDLDDSMFMEAE